MTSHYLHVIHVHGYAIMRTFDLCVVCVCVCVRVCVCVCVCMCVCRLFRNLCKEVRMYAQKFIDKGRVRHGRG